MKDHEVDMLLRKAVNEIKGLRRHNSLLQSKAEAYEVLKIAIMGLTRQGGQGEGEDVVYAIEMALERMKEDEAKASKKTS